MTLIFHFGVHDPSDGADRRGSAFTFSLLIAHWACDGLEISVILARKRSKSISSELSTAKKTSRHG